MVFPENDKAAAESSAGFASVTVGQKNSIGGNVGSGVGAAVGARVDVVGLDEMVGWGDTDGDAVGADVGAIETVGLADGVAVGLRVANRSHASIPCSIQVGVKAWN